MSGRRPYAATTEVPIPQSKADLERTVRRYGADSFGILEIGNAAHVVFSLEGRKLRFSVQLPEKDQERRSIWRAVLLTIKAKLESSERGIETFEEAFMANIVMPDGRTVAETAGPQIEAAYQGRDVPLLPGY